MCEKQWWEWVILYGPAVLWAVAVWGLRGVEQRHKAAITDYRNARKRYYAARQRLIDRYGIATDEEDPDHA